MKNPIPNPVDHESKTVFIRPADKGDRLEIRMEPDGGTVVICHGLDEHGSPARAAIKFLPTCFGGLSPNTKEALYRVIEGIEKDNEEHPIVIETDCDHIFESSMVNMDCETCTKCNFVRPVTKFK